MAVAMQSISNAYILRVNCIIQSVYLIWGNSAVLFVLKTYFNKIVVCYIVVTLDIQTCTAVLELSES